MGWNSAHRPPLAHRLTTGAGSDRCLGRGTACWKGPTTPFFPSDAAPRELRKTAVARRNLSVRGNGHYGFQGRANSQDCEALRARPAGPPAGLASPVAAPAEMRRCCGMTDGSDISVPVRPTERVFEKTVDFSDDASSRLPLLEPR